MALKDNYYRTVSLRCMTCGATYAFKTDEKTGYITCLKCNRIYRGGEDELAALNEALIEEEQNMLIEEVQKDIEKEIDNIFRSLKI